MLIEIPIEGKSIDTIERIFNDSLYTLYENQQYNKYMNVIFNSDYEPRLGIILYVNSRTYQNLTQCFFFEVEGDTPEERVNFFNSKERGMYIIYSKPFYFNCFLKYALIQYVVKT